VKLYRRQKSPFWYASFSAKVGGRLRQVRVSTGERDRTVARYRALDMEAKHRAKMVVRGDAPIVTVADFIARYESHAKATMQPRTYAASTVALKKLLHHRGRPLADITPMVADSIVSELAATMKPRSVNVMVSRLRSAFKMAVRWDLTNRNPFEGVKPIAVHREPPRVFTMDELRRLFAVIDERYPSLSDLFRFYLHTGMRRSEALSLKWENVDFERGYIRLLKTKGRTYRDVPMLVHARAILERRRNLPRPFPHTGPEVDAAFRRSVEAAKITGAKIHGFRRTFITRMLNLGIPIYAIQQWVGHVDAETTTEDYMGRLDRFDEEAKRLPEAESV
jgi:integrase